MTMAYLGRLDPEAFQQCTETMVGYIREKNGGTFGYIRVHSGTFGYIRAPSPGAGYPMGPMETQRIVGGTPSCRGTFGATTHPFYKTKRGNMGNRVRKTGATASF